MNIKHVALIMMSLVGIQALSAKTIDIINSGENAIKVFTPEGIVKVIPPHERASLTYKTIFSWQESKPLHTYTFFKAFTPEKSIMFIGNNGQYFYLDRNEQAHATPLPSTKTIGIVNRSQNTIAVFTSKTNHKTIQPKYHTLLNYVNKIYWKEIGSEKVYYVAAVNENAAQLIVLDNGQYYDGGRGYKQAQSFEFRSWQQIQ